MNMTRRTLLQIAALALVALPVTGCSYNTFVSQEENVKAQWAQVQNQLQRRNDLIPNLVETTKGFAQHEESVYKDIAESRSKLLAAKSPEETIAAANQQTSALGRLLAVVENYPQLKANEQFNRLMDELAGTDLSLALVRRNHIREIALADIGEVERSQSAIERLCGVSTLIVHARRGRRTPFVLSAIRRATPIAALLELLSGDPRATADAD